MGRGRGSGGGRGREGGWVGGPLCEILNTPLRTTVAPLHGSQSINQSIIYSFIKKQHKMTMYNWRTGHARPGNSS